MPTEPVAFNDDDGPVSLEITAGYAVDERSERLQILRRGLRHQDLHARAACERLPAADD